MKLSLIIPANDEEGSIESTIKGLISTLRIEKLNFDILVVNDNSTDSTEMILKKLYYSILRELDGC